MKCAKRIVLAVLLLWAVLCLTVTPVRAEDANEVKAAGKRLSEALDKDPSISPEVKKALKAFVRSVEKSRRVSPGVSKRQDKLFKVELEKYFKERKDILPEGALLAKYDKGFKLSTADKRFKFQFGGRVQADFRGFNHDQENAGVTDSFFLRRARLFAKGTLYKDVHFKVQAEFAGSMATLKDGYINLTYFGDVAQVKMGQFKQPFGYEELTSSKYIDFIERSLATDNMAPSRDSGVMVHGKFHNGMFAYQLGLFNGNGSNKKDEDSDKDLAARFVVRPFKDCDSELFQGLSFGVNATHGNQTSAGSGKSFKTAADTTFMKFATITNADRSRYGVDMQWFYGPASVQAEWISSRWSKVRIGSRTDDVRVDGWYVMGSYLITGEKKIRKRIKPKRNFDPAKGGWGAWEVVARYEMIQAQGNPLSSGIVTPGFADGARAATVGFNLYLNEMTRFSVNYVHTWFDDSVLVGSSRVNDEGSLLARFYVEF